jgi:ribosomal protein S14
MSRLNHRNCTDHTGDDYEVACIVCGKEVAVLEAFQLDVSDFFLCRVCYLAFTNHRPDLKQS